MKVQIHGKDFEIPTFEAAGRATTFACGDGLYAHTIDGAALVTRVERFPLKSSASHGAASSPMPGLVLKVLVTPGQAVNAGVVLVVIEAMKMEQTIKAAIDGRVSAVRVKPGDVVTPGQTLIEIDAWEGSDEHTSRTANGN